MIFVFDNGLEMYVDVVLASLMSKGALETSCLKQTNGCYRTCRKLAVATEPCKFDASSPGLTSGHVANPMGEQRQRLQQARWLSRAVHRGCVQGGGACASASAPAANAAMVGRGMNYEGLWLKALLAHVQAKMFTDDGISKTPPDRSRLGASVRKGRPA